MQTEYNLDFLLENTGCYKKSKVENLFPKDREVVSYKDILQSNIPLDDKYWFFCHRVFKDSQNRHLAIKIAEVVLPIFEDKYPEIPKASNVFHVHSKSYMFHKERMCRILEQKLPKKFTKVV